MASPKTPRMEGKRYGKLIVLKNTGTKQGPHFLFLCWLDDDTELGQFILVRGNNLRSRGYSGKPLRRTP